MRWLVWQMKGEHSLMLIANLTRILTLSINKLIESLIKYRLGKMLIMRAENWLNWWDHRIGINNTKSMWKTCLRDENRHILCLTPSLMTWMMENWTVSRSAAGINLGAVAITPMDHAAIQMNLGRLRKRARRTLTKFNKSKWKSCTLGRRRNNPRHQYRLQPMS